MTEARDFNVATRLSEVAERLGTKPAVIVEPKSGVATTTTFFDLERTCRRFSRGLSNVGVKRGSRVLVFVPPSVEFFALVFGLFRLGAVPVLIDPGLGLAGLKMAISEAEPDVFVGIAKAQLLRIVARRALKSVRCFVVTNGPRWMGDACLDDLEKESDAPLSFSATRRDDLAAILYTSGSTGPAKGALYTHGIFDAQLRILAREWNLGEADVDLPAFPLFALFSAGLGVTSVVPRMDAARPASVDPATVIDQIQRHAVTYSFGSPAFWGPVSDYVIANRCALPTLKKVFIAGAPVSPRLVTRVRQMLTADSADVFVPYGATESLPVAWISGGEVEAETSAQTWAGRGLCVGRPIAEANVRVVEVRADPIATMRDVATLPPMAVGELVVRGPVTTQGYFRRPADDARSKIRDADGGALWHRMGDLGYVDDVGRVWFCGRKAHRVHTANGPMDTICAEAIFNQHAAVRRSALVGIPGRNGIEPAIVVELASGAEKTGSHVRGILLDEFLALARSHAHTRPIEAFLIHPAFPVDVRHNAKINREALAIWAARVLDKSGKLRA